LILIAIISLNFDFYRRNQKVSIDFGAEDPGFSDESGRAEDILVPARHSARKSKPTG
jgi:hypothetical protein